VQQQSLAESLQASTSPVLELIAVELEEWAD
jgi:hypothetical protein